MRRGRARGRATARPRAPALPRGPLPISTGTAELVVSPGHPTGVTVLVNGVPSSHVDLADPRRLEFEYMQQMAAVIDLLPAGPLRAVHLGAAGCTLARYVHATRPGSQQLAIEIDPRLAELARSWLDVPRSPALRIRVGDARAELETLPARGADVVVRDVFAGDRTPDHVRTTGFARAARRALRPGGTLLVNCADRPPLHRVRAEAATLRTEFGHVWLLAEPPVLRGRRYGNLVLVASDRPPVDPARLDRRLRTIPAPARLVDGAELRAFAAGSAPVTDPPSPAAPGTAPAPGGTAAPRSAPPPGTGP